MVEQSERKKGEEYRNHKAGDGFRLVILVRVLLELSIIFIDIVKINSLFNTFEE